MTYFSFLRSQYVFSCALPNWYLVSHGRTWFLIYRAIRMCRGSLCDMTIPIIYVINRAGRFVSSPTALCSHQRAQPWHGNGFFFKFMYLLHLQANYVSHSICIGTIFYFNTPIKIRPSNPMHYFIHACDNEFFFPHSTSRLNSLFYRGCTRHPRNFAHPSRSQRWLHFQRQSTSSFFIFFTSINLSRFFI